MCYLEIKYIGDKPNVILENPTIPFHFERGEYIHLYDKTELSSLIEDYTSLSDSLVLHMARHAFYHNNVGAENNICTFMYLSKKEFCSQKKYLSLLFKKITIICEQNDQEDSLIYQIKVQGISNDGLVLLDKMKLNGCLPPILLDFYIEKSYADDYNENAFFELLQKHDYIYCDNLDVWTEKQLVYNKWINSFDVSALTMQQCLEHPLIKVIVNQKRKVYIYICECMEVKNLYHKILYWLH